MPFMHSDLTFTIYLIAPVFGPFFAVPAAGHELYNIDYNLITYRQ